MKASQYRQAAVNDAIDLTIGDHGQCIGGAVSVSFGDVVNYQHNNKALIIAAILLYW